MLGDVKEIQAATWFVGSRLDVRALERRHALAVTPLTLRAGERGVAVLFRFGVAVLFQLDPLEQEAFLKGLAPFVDGGFGEPEQEEADLRIDPDASERVDPSGTILLREASLERLQTVAEILAKSAVLSHYEDRVARVFDDVESLARGLQTSAHRAGAHKQLLQEIGNVLVIQAQTVGRVEVTEKPEITWDRPELDRLYERLAIEYELRDRDRALARKLEVISQTAETYHDLLQNRQMLRVEWYIVALIAIEIAIILWDMFAAG